MRTLRGWGLLLIVLTAASTAERSDAQSYPSRSIRIQTSGAGAGPDSVARPLASELSATLGQPVVVENRPSGFILASGVAKAAPDGYTLLVFGGSLWIAPLFEEAPYDPIRDFSSIALLARSPNILLVNPSLPVTAVADLVKLAKAAPGKFNYTSGANGGSPHLAGELFKSMAGVDIVRVSYKSGALEVADLLSGQVHMTFGSVATWGPQIKAGKVRAIATGGPRRSLLFPDLPPVAETLPGFASESLLAFWAPARTPEPVVRRLNQETGRALEKREFRERLLQSGQEPGGGAPELLTEAIKSEMARVGKLIKDLGIKAGDS